MQPIPTIDAIIIAACEHAGIDTEQFYGTGRHPDAVRARRLAAYTLRHWRKLSYPEIAIALGKKNGSHTNAIDQARHVPTPETLTELRALAERHATANVSDPPRTAARYIRPSERTYAAIVQRIEEWNKSRAKSPNEEPRNGGHT